MDTSWLDGSQFDAIPIGGTGLISANWLHEIAMYIIRPFRNIGDRDIYGSFTATRVDAPHFTWFDAYNFETHPGEPLRNLVTGVAGPGKGFNIYGPSPI